MELCYRKWMDTNYYSNGNVHCLYYDRYCKQTANHNGLQREKHMIDASFKLTMA